jgi:hypothetical protein
MLRRDFLKNSIGALLGVALTSNKALATIVETLDSNSPKVLLYLVETITGDIKVRATKWVDLPIKRLIPSEVKPETFKALEIVDVDKVYQRRLELWKEHNCTGRMGHLVSMGIPMTDEMKKEYGEQASKNHKGKKRSVEIRKKISLKAIGRISSRKGVICSEEVRKKMSESGKVKIFTDEHKNNISKATTGIKNPFYGKKHNQETLIKISQSTKQRPNGMLGKKHSDETKKKIAEKSKIRKTITKPVNLYSYEIDFFIGKFKSYGQAARFVNANPECLRLTINGKRNHSNGFYARWAT